jgi:hypothetical protein
MGGHTELKHMDVGMAILVQALNDVVDGNWTANRWSCNLWWSLAVRVGEGRAKAACAPIGFDITKQIGSSVRRLQGDQAFEPLQL